MKFIALKIKFQLLLESETGCELTKIKREKKKHRSGKLRFGLIKGNKNPMGNLFSLLLH